MQQDNPKLNASGCKDLVAYEAIKTITKENCENDKKAAELIRVLKRFIRGCGYEPLNRIAIKNKATGKEYR
ncbi:hypothetical protein [Anaerovorax sp. IOR16]|uniref:hypothetical protein n=1 Tax=Anaerovorax sp. IOR16 TaxID=2773458 RepID=UPI0019D2E1B7|nr:hypothetical protein [Anaerovorax sp. IOR16]